MVACVHAFMLTWSFVIASNRIELYEIIELISKLYVLMWCFDQSLDQMHFENETISSGGALHFHLVCISTRSAFEIAILNPIVISFTKKLIISQRHPFDLIYQILFLIRMQKQGERKSNRIHFVVQSIWSESPFLSFCTAQ